MANLLDNLVAAQSTIPDEGMWWSNAYDVADTAEENEMMDWYLQNRGVQGRNGEYFGPELKRAPRGMMNAGARQVGQPMRQFEPYQETPGWMDAAGDVILGYDPREGADGYEPEYEDSPLYDAAFGAFVPGGNVLSRGARKIGAAAFGGIIGNDVAEGRRLGALDIAFAGGLAASAGNRVKRAGDAFRRGYQQGRARRAYENAMRSRTLDGPRTRRFNAGTHRWDEYYEPEFTPYEEVRF